jgi:hypothetical protein
MGVNIEGATRLDDPAIPVATSVVGLITHGMQNGKTVQDPTKLLVKSPYQLAVEKGFVGTEEEWLESLKTSIAATINSNGHLIITVQPNATL